MDRIAMLETRITRGETYLEAHPDDAKSKKLYWDVVTEYTALVEQQEREADIKAVVLDLPPGTSWQREADSPVCSRVRLVYPSAEGPEGEADITRAELAALLATRKAVIAAKEGASA